MSLNEKANQKYGGMCKSVKSVTLNLGEEAKKSIYNKEYHYPSGAGARSSIRGGNGPVSQHLNTDGIKHFKPSNG